MRNYSILLVDDEKIIRDAVSSDLKDKGYHVTLAASGEEAVRLLTEGSERPRYDLIITDLKMKGISGIEVLEEAKKADPEVMVVILTGYGSLPSAVDAIRMDADDYILKPCKSKELHFRIARCLERLELKRKLKLYEDILPVCCVCKKIRDDAGKKHGTGEWLTLEGYMRTRAKLDVSHGYCPECAEKVVIDLKAGG